MMRAAAAATVQDSWRLPHLPPNLWRMTGVGGVRGKYSTGEINSGFVCMCQALYIIFHFPVSLFPIYPNCGDSEFKLNTDIQFFST